MINEFIVTIVGGLVLLIVEKYFFNGEHLNKLLQQFHGLRIYFRSKGAKMKPSKNYTHVLKIWKDDEDRRYSWELLQPLTFKVILKKREGKETIKETIGYVLPILYMTYKERYDGISICEKPYIEGIYSFFEVTIEKINSKDK